MNSWSNGMSEGCQVWLSCEIIAGQIADDLKELPEKDKEVS